MTATEPLTDAYLAKAEKDARRFQGAWTGTSGTLAAHVMRLLGEIRRLRTPPKPVPPAPPAIPPLVDAINRQTAALIQDKNPALDRFLYISQDPYGKRFDRNPMCWIGGTANLTCISPAQLSGTPWHLRAGTLITRRHVVYANHFGVPIIDGGTPLLFIQRDGQPVTRKVVAQAADAASDIAVGLLDADVPESIAVAPVLPPDFERHFAGRHKFLAVTLDAEEKASVQQCLLWDGQFATNTLDMNYVEPEYKRLAAWSEATVTGDSGNPVFVLIDGELVLLGCWWTAQGGSHLGARHEVVARLLEQLSPGQGYRVTVKKL